MPLKEQCPACGSLAGFRRVLVDRKNIPWYRYAAETLYCSECHKRIQVVTKQGLPFALAIFTVVSIVAFIGAVALREKEIIADPLAKFAGYGVLVIIWASGSFLMRHYFEYEAVQDDSQPSLNSNG